MPCLPPPADADTKSSLPPSADFVQTLNSTHPSTVSTIARTSHKLLFPGFVGPDRKPLGDKAKKVLWTEGRICPLCEL